MAMELSVSSRFGLPLIRYSSIWSRKTRLQATTKAELQSTIGVSDPYVAPTSASAVPVHRVTVNDRQRGVVHQFLVPEDQYILHTAESQDISLPFACRHGCCTSCAVRVKSGEIRQPEALGISSELKSKIRDFINQGREEERFARLSETKQSHLLQIPHIFKWMYQGYALLCVGFPTSDIEVETQDEDEVYWLQFGRYFARGPIERDDYALELAMADE